MQACNEVAFCFDRLVIVSYYSTCLLQILGLGLFVLGILMKVNVSAINNDVKPALNGVTVASYKLGNLVDSLAILFIVIGAFILIVSGLGLFGACCEVKCMLVTVSVLIFIQIVSQSYIRNKLIKTRFFLVTLWKKIDKNLQYFNVGNSCGHCQVL